MAEGDLIWPATVPGSWYQEIIRLQREQAELTARYVNVATLGEISPDLGEIRAGTFYTNAGEPGDLSYTGLAISQIGWADTPSGATINLGSWLAGVLQVGWDGATGKFIAGGGDVVLDVDGIHIITGDLNANQLVWAGESPTYTAFRQWVAAPTGATPNRSSQGYIYCYAEDGGTGSGKLSISAIAGDASVAGIVLTTGYAIDPIRYLEPSGQAGIIHRGDEAGYKVVTASVTPTDMYTRTIAANAMGAFGSFEVEYTGSYHNTGATSVSSTIDVIFGTTTLFSFTPPVTTTTNPRYVTFRFKVRVTNRGATNSQLAHILEFESTQGTLAANMATLGLSQNRTNTAAEDTTAARTLTIKQTLNTATNSQFEQLGVIFSGPHLHSS